MIDFEAAHDRPQFKFEGGTFICRDDGVFYCTKIYTVGGGGEYKMRELWICDALDVIAITGGRHSGLGWGRLLVWRDPDNRVRWWDAPIEDLHEKASYVRRCLTKDGLAISPGREQQMLLKAYLSGHPVQARAYYDKGWRFGIRPVPPGDAVPT